jgi:uncharacterized protein (DUF433 family)
VRNNTASPDRRNAISSEVIWGFHERPLEREVDLKCGPLTLSAMKYLDRITSDPEQCGGRPCIRSMRIRVKDVLEMLAAGVGEMQILEDFPYLETEDIRACLEFAAAEMDHAILNTA